MTSFRQIEANRGNALRSTGPNTEAGKTAGTAKCSSTRIDRRNRRCRSGRHRDYQAFEADVIADYDTRMECELEVMSSSSRRRFSSSLLKNSKSDVRCAI